MSARFGKRHHSEDEEDESTDRQESSSESEEPESKRQKRTDSPSLNASSPSRSEAAASNLERQIADVLALYTESSEKKRAAHFVRMMASLRWSSINSILLVAAMNDPEIGKAVEVASQELLDEEAEREHDFDHVSKSVWHLINTKHSRLRMSDQYMVAFGIVPDVELEIKGIANAVKPHSSFGTKRSALETLRKIGKTLCLSAGDEIACRVHDRFQENNCLEKAMLTVVKRMSREERENMRDAEDGKFLLKLEELIDLSQQRSMLANVDRVWDELTEE